MSATKKFGLNQKLTGSKNLSHRPKDEANGHMGAQLLELNETIRWIFKVKKISKMFKDHAKKTII